MIRHPSSVIVAGPSGSGKSDLTERLLREQKVFQHKPRKIVYCYDRWQPRFERMKRHMLFYKGIPDASLLTKWFGPTKGGVLVLDDLMAEGGQDKQVLDFFTKDSIFGVSPERGSPMGFYSCGLRKFVRLGS